jgi:hypothetical protein
VTSDNAALQAPDRPGTTSDNTSPTQIPRRARAQAVPLPAHLEVVLAEYAAALQRAPVDDDTRRAYSSRARQYLAWLGAAAVDRDPLTDPAGRDWAVRDYRAHLQGVAKRKPSTINTTLAAIADFYTRRGLGPPDVRRLELPQTAPRALTPREATRWLRAAQGCPRPRDQLLGFILFYAGLLSARRWLSTLTTSGCRPAREC